MCQRFRFDQAGYRVNRRAGPDIDDDFLAANSEPFGSSRYDPPIGLMGGVASAATTSPDRSGPASTFACRVR